MRQFAICAILALCLGASAAIDPQFEYYGKDLYAFEGTINETIEGIRPDIPDPLIVESLPLDFPDNGTDPPLVGSAELTNLEITGLQGFQLTALNFAMVGMRLNFTLVLPSLNVNSDYSGDLLLLGLVPLYGAGKLNIHIEGLEVQASAQADLSDGIQVKGLRLQVYVGASTFDIHGALNSEDFSVIASELLNDVFTSFVDNHQPVISDILSPIVETIVNTLLAGLSTDTTVAPTAAP